MRRRFKYMVEYRVDRGRFERPDYFGTAFFGLTLESSESADSIFNQIYASTFTAYNELEKVKKDKYEATSSSELHLQKITILASFDSIP